MVISHKVSFQLGSAFEQHSAEFSLSLDDLPKEYIERLSALDVMRIMNSLVLIQGNLFQLSEGYIDEETMKKRVGRIHSLLPKKLQAVLGKMCEATDGN